MRRFVALLLSLVLLLTLAATGSAASDIRVLFDEQEIQFDANPFVANDRTLVPVRALAERLGFAVGWDEGEQKITLTKGDTTMLLWIGSTKVVVNGEEATLEVAPRKVNDRTFVPVRFVAERLGAHVAWDPQQNAAVITSGKSMLSKLTQAQQKPVDQKMTADLQVQVEFGALDDPNGGTMTLKVPMHADLHLHQNDMLMAVTMKMPGMGLPGSDPIAMHLAMKDGKLYTQDSFTEEWHEEGSADLSDGVAGFAALFGQTGPGVDFAKLQDEMLKEATVSFGGPEEVDGVKAIRLDVDLSKVNFEALFGKLLASLDFPVDQAPAINMHVDRYRVHYWINPETQFVHKTTLDLALTMAVTEFGDNMSFKVALKGDLRATPGSEPIKFPDFTASAFTPEQKRAAQAYWDTLQEKDLLYGCAATATEADAHWKAKSFKAGHDAAVQDAACFTKQREALASLTPPKEFAEGHKALSLSAETSEKAYTVLADAFDLAAKGDMAASDARKAEAAKLAAAGDQGMMQADNLLFKAAMKFGLFK